MNFLTLLLIGSITLLLLTNQTVSNANTIDDTNTTNISINNSFTDNYSLYNEVIDNIMRFESVSNIGMKYIGYDIKCPTISNTESIDTYIQNALAEYNVGVFNLSSDVNTSKKFPSILNDSKGIIITIDKISYTDKNIDISFTKSFVNKDTATNQNYNSSRIITNSPLEFVF